MPTRRLLVLLLLLAPAGAAQKATAPPDAKARVDTIFSRFNRRDSPGCAVGASIGGEPVLMAGYGMSDLEHDVHIVPDTIFEPGSVTKQFTAAAVLLLAQQGKLSLDDPIRKYLPELPDADASITIRHLLNHTSGLRDWGSLEGIAGWPRTTRANTHANVLEILSRQNSLNYPPGAEYSYTNSGYNLAAILVGRVAGKSLAAFTRDNIFGSLGMTSTSWRDDFRRIVKGRAIAYRQSGNEIRQLMPFEDVHGNGGLLTTVGDLLRWNRNFVTAKVGGKAFVEQQHVRGVLTSGRTIAYAAGLMVLHYKGLNEVGHSGTTAGYNAWLGRYPDQELSVAILCNTTSANGTQLGHAVADVFLGAAAKAPVPPEGTVEASRAGMYRSTRDHSVMNVAAGADASRYRFEAGDRLRVVTEGDEVVWEKVERWTPSAPDLQSFAGEYASDEAGVTLTIAVENGGLVVRRRPDTRILLAPTYKNGFNAPGLGSVRFLSDDAGRIAELSVGESRVWDLRFHRMR
jgi:CubicO group peptidase (beta-lactamase class C family)